MVLREMSMPCRSNIFSWRCGGWWSAHFATITCASKLAPAVLFSIGCGGSEPDWFAGGGDAWNTLLTNESVRRDVNRWLGSEFMQTRYELQVRRYANIEQVEYPIMELLEPMETPDEELDVDSRDSQLIVELLKRS